LIMSDDAHLQMNRIQLLGMVRGAPNIQRTGQDEAVAHLKVSTRRLGTSAQWHKVEAWEALAESIERGKIADGDTIFVEGHMEYSTYERDGVQIPTAVVVAHFIVRMHDGRRR
jgi:single-stranded DNA-binding protein